MCRAPGACVGERTAGAQPGSDGPGGGRLGVSVSEGCRLRADPGAWKQGARVSGGAPPGGAPAPCGWCAPPGLGLLAAGRLVACAEQQFSGLLLAILGGDCVRPAWRVGREGLGGHPLDQEVGPDSQAPSAPGLQTDSLRQTQAASGPGLCAGAWEPREVPGALAEGGGGGGWFFTPESEAGGAGPVTWPWGGAWEPVLAESCPTTNQLLTDRASPDPLSHAHGHQCPPLLAGHGPSRPGLCVRPFPLACEPRRPSAAHRCVRGGQGRGAVHPADLQPL